MKLITTAFLLLSSQAFSMPLERLQEKGCVETFETIATNFVSENQNLVKAWTLKARIDSSDLIDLQLCEVSDLTQGSLRIIREASFCNKDGRELVLFTQGNLWCSDEVVLGVSSVK